VVGRKEAGGGLNEYFLVLVDKKILLFGFDVLISERNQ